MFEPRISRDKNENEINTIYSKTIPTAAVETVKTAEIDNSNKIHSTNSNYNNNYNKNIKKKKNITSFQELEKNNKTKYNKNNSEKTIDDFNRRRRRGRLRLNNSKKIDDKNIINIISNIITNIIHQIIIRNITILIKIINDNAQAAGKIITATVKNGTSVNSAAAYRRLMLLLSFIIDYYVNLSEIKPNKLSQLLKTTTTTTIIQKLCYTIIQTQYTPIAEVKEINCSNINTSADCSFIKSNNTIIYAPTAKTTTIKRETSLAIYATAAGGGSYDSSVGEIKIKGAETAMFTATTTMEKSKSSKWQLQQRYEQHPINQHHLREYEHSICTSNSRSHSRCTGITSNTSSKSNNSHSNSRSRSGSNNIQLIYAFILCTSILLPCSNNSVMAAKPKSATQLQQQKEQQQHKHANAVHSSNANANAVGVPLFIATVPLTPPSYQIISQSSSSQKQRTSNEDTELSYPSSQSEEQPLLFDEEEENFNNVDEDKENAAYESLNSNETQFDPHNVTKAPLFPKDLFSKHQLEHGAIAFHVIGVIYMFVALAIVCDEFFVPSLDVIIEKLDITDDVAGATFMAAGGSAPELFTSVIGVFISFDDVGIGTIVGSAVFNILFVIGMCALFSKTVLTLTWWPLFRDCSFYSISLMVLIYFFRDNFIWWWEALILFLIYAAYVAFMKWNVQVERCVKKIITKNKVTRVRSTDQLMPANNAANSSETSVATQPGGSVTSRAASETRSGPPGTSSGAGATGNSSGNAGSTHTGAKFRHGLLQLMIHTIDPLHDGKVDEKATQLHAIASLKVLLDATKPQRGGATTSAANHVKINLKETTLADRPNGNIDTTLESNTDVQEQNEPVNMSWPDTARKRLTYVLVAPLIIPMWLTLPDTRTPRGRKYFAITFIGSILWIAAFSYLMVWWANVIGDTVRIPPEVMGLTFLAAGTSIPDLITSVIVARKGFGDMAVSSSVGSNIFDVTVGLPIPWLLFGIIYDAPVEVNSVGMVCSITILFMMLIFVVISIACFHWRMNKGLGFTMFLLYFAFVAVSLMFEYDVIDCPV